VKQKEMKFWYTWLILALITAALAGCGPRRAALPSADEGSGKRSASPIDTVHPDALNVVSQFALGTLALEETAQAVTPEQAAGLLPLWKMLEGDNALRGDAETAAVLKQIEGKMSEAQLTAIAAMQLTQEDLSAWAQSQGLHVPPGGQGLSSEERAKLRTELGNLSAEERATRQAELGGRGRPGVSKRGGAGEGPGQTGSGQPFAILVAPLIELLTLRAAE
jgi:hypothetical protein